MDFLICQLVCLSVSHSLCLVCFGRDAYKCNVNIMKMYIERNNLTNYDPVNILPLFTFTFAKRGIQCNIANTNLANTTCNKNQYDTVNIFSLFTFNFAKRPIRPPNA